MHVGEVLRRAPDSSGVAESAASIGVDRASRHGIARALAPGSRSRSAWWVSSTASAGVVEHEGEPLRRVGRIERHVGAAGLEHAEQRDDQSRASARRQTPTSDVRARRPRRAGAARAGSRGRRARRRSALAVAQTSGDRVGRPPACASKQLVDAAAPGSPPAVAFHSTSSCRALRRRSSSGSSR